GGGVGGGEGGAVGGEAEVDGAGGGVEVGEREGRAGEPGAGAAEVGERLQAGGGLRQGGGNAGLVRRAAEDGGAHALDEDVPDEGAVGVAVEDANDLVHAGAGARRFRLQRRGPGRPAHLAGDGRAAVRGGQPT